MKTTIENKAEPVAPVTYPAIFRNDDGCTAIATSSNAGIYYSQSGSRWALETGGLTWGECGWKPITTPITITFDPTK
jgi:hypothetical protein